MGNVESRPINRPIIEVSHKTARPLPPLPDDEIDEYDLDSPPPYPPPPPPHEENGGKSKRISWKFKEPSFFGGLKRGSWVLQPHSESDPTYKYHDTKKGTPTFTGKNISNTIATEDNNVVTVSVIGTPDKDDVIKSHNDSTTMDGSQNSWAVRNMQLVLNSEINSSSSSKRNISDSDKVEPSLESKNYPYPDVQTYSENEMSSLPDVVTVKTRKLDTSNEGNVSVTKETVHLKRVEDIRLDYPEGKTREVSNYNTLEYKEHTSVQPLSLQVEHDVSSGRASADVKNDSKSKKGKLPSCFGKRKADDIIDEEFDDTAFSIENQRSGASSPESKTLSLSPSSEINLNVTPASSTPKKTKKTKIGSCFSKSPSKDEIDGPLSTSTPDIDSRLNLRGSGSIGGSSERVEYITPKLEVESDIDTSLRKDAKSPKKPKSNFGSCFGKDKLGKLDKSLDNEGEYQGGLQLKAEGEYQGGLELKADKSSSIPDSDINADLKTKNLKHSKKSPLTAWFGKDSKHKYEVTNASEEFEIKTDHDDVVGRVDVRTPEIELKKEGMSKNVNIDNEIEIALPTADFEIKSPEANISLEGSSLKTDLHTNINPELTAKFPEKYSQSTDFNFSPSKNIHVDLQTPEIDIKQPTLEIETPKLMLKDSDIPDNNLALNLDANLKNGEIERKSKEMNISYSPTLEFKDNNFNSNQKLEIIPPCVDLRINPDVTGEEIEFQPVDLDKSLEINLKPQPLDIKGSIDVPSANIELQKNDELKLEIPGFIAQEPKQPYDLPELNLEIDTHGKGDINSGKIEIDLATPKIEPQLSIQPKKIDKPKKPKAKFGSCFGKPKADVDMDVQSPELKAEGQVKTAPINVSSPSIEVEGFVANADDAEVKGDVELRGPKIEGKIPKESGKGKFKLGSCLGKDKSKPAKVEKREIDVDIPEGDVKGSVNVETPKIEGDVNIGKENVDVKKPKVDGKGKVGLGSCFGKSKTPKVETEVNVPETDISGPSVSGGELEADVKVKSPKLDVKGDIDSSLIKSDIDVETPEIKVDAKKKKGSLGSCFGKRKSPDADIKKPSLEVEGEIKGVPSIEGEMKVEGELPSGEIPSKKKKGNLGSCFGKKDKPKLKADIDIEPPKAKLSEDIPSVNIEANVPDVTLDPNIKAGTLDLNINNDKPEMSFDLPSVNVEGNIPEASLDVDVPSVSLKSPDIDLDFPKCEGKIEGKVPDISLSHNVDFDGESPDLDFNGDVDFSVEGPKLPSAELDLGVSGSDIKLKKIEGTVEGELPKFDPKFDIDIDTSLPKTNVEIAAPEITMKKEGSVKVPTPDIDIDISGNVPDVELEGDVKVEAPTVDVKGPKIKGKKFKSKMPSCFGKDDKTKKGDAYMPSCEGEISVKSPDVTGKVDVESPSLEGDASIRGPDLKVETKKPKGKLGSCFGKPKSPKAPKVEGKLSSSVEGDLPTLKGEIDAPKAEVKVDVEKPTKKSSSGLGSCFGKKAKVDANIETPSVDVAAPSGELSVDVDSPQFKSDIKVEEPNLKAKAVVKKPKSKFGSCFGKPKADVDMTVDSPELETDVKVKTPSLDISTPSVGVEGSVDVPSVGIDDAKLEGDVELRGPKVEGKTPKGSGKGKFKLGSCLGKDKSKSVKVDKPEAEVVIPEGGIKGSVELEAPKIEGDVKGPKVDGKRKLGLGSCFGKSKSPKLQAEVDVPEPNISGPSTSSGKLDADIKLKSPELDIKADVDSPVIKSEIDVETPEIKVDGKKKKKGSLGSCFGKRKSTDADIKKPSLEVEGEIKGVPSIEGEMKVEGELPSGEIPSKKKKLNLGSCFGKKDKPKLKADIDIQPPKADISTEIPSVNIEANVPDVTLDPNIKAGTLDLNINNDKPEMSFDLPSVNVEGNIPEASLDVDVPSVSLKSPDIDLDFPKCEGKIGGKVPDISLSHNVDLDVESPDLDYKGGVDYSVKGPELPSAELDLGVSGSDIKLPKIEGTVEGELPKFDPKFDIDIDTSLPKTDVQIAAPKISMEKEGRIKVPTPDIDIDISGNVPDVELEGDVKVEAPTVDVKGPKIKGKKVKSKMPSCFGKGDKTKKGDAYMPSCEGEISVKSPDVTGKVDVESPSLEGDASIRGPDLKVETKKPKGKLGSCFGKPKSPKAPKVEGKLSSSVEGELPTLKGEIDAPKAEVKVDVQKPTKKSSSGLGSCFGKKAKVDANIETPSVDVAAPSGELSVDVDSPQLKSDIKVEEPNLKVKGEVKKPKSKFGSCFGKPKADVDMTVDSPELETDVKVKTPSLDISTPSVGVEGSIDVPSVGIDDTKLEGDVELRGPKVEGKTPKGSGKGKFKLGSCFGKDKSKSIKVDKPEAEVVIPEGGIKGSVEVEAPKIEGDVKGPKVDGKRKLGLGSCFGKSKSPKLQAEVDVPEPNISGPSTSGGKLDADIKLKSPELDIKADVDSPVIKSEIDVETPEIKVDGKKKKKGSLGSCFGKRKSTDADIKKPSLEVEGDIKGVPSIEGEMKVEGELPSGEIPSKKKKLNLGSCFGKKDKPKLKADIDIQPPKVEISPEIPSVNIEANVPDVTLDPSIKTGTLDLNINNDKPELSFDLPSVNVEGKIPEASLDVDVPSVSLKSPDIDLDFPKCEGKIEGKVPDISLSHNVDFDGESPDLDFKGDVDFSVKGPKLPSAELDLDVSGSDIKLPKIEGTVEGELPKFDPKFDIDIDTSLPKTDVEIAAPKISMEKEGRIKVPTPDIDIDISGNVPDVDLEGDVKVEAPTVDVKGPKIKGKKVKSKMPSCFGKGDKAKKGDAYMPSCEGEISVKSPDVTGKVDVESPSLEGDASIRGPDLKVETKKPKGKLGSCFGKPKSPKAPKVEGKLSSSVEGELPTLKGEIDAPKAEVKVDVQKPTKKSSSGLGSCFGKKAKVDANIKTPSVDVAAPSGELSVDVDSPQLKSDIKVEEPNLKAKAEVKKPKSKFGSCFGKPKADVDMTVDSPELETDVKVKTPSLDISTPSVGVEGSVDVPSVGIDDAKLEGDVELRGPKVEGKTPKGSGKGKFKLGSCFGKDKSKSVKVDKPEAEVVIPEGGIKGSVEVEAPKIEGDVKGPMVQGKSKLGLGSCFGRSKSPKLQAEVDVPEPNISGPSTSGGKLDADIKLKSPELDIKADVDSPVIKSEIDLETPEIKVDGKKKKGTLGSCFGKRKSTDADIKKPSLEVEGEIKGVPSIEGEMKVEGELQSGEIPSKKKKLNLGSCFGKKDKPKLKADIDIQPPKAEISPEIPSVNIEANVPDVTLDPSIKAGTLDLNINNDKPEMSFDLPSVNVEGNIPEASLDVDVPSVSLKSPDIDLDFPKCEGKIEGKVPDISLSHNVDFDVESTDLDFNGDLDFSVEGPKLPSAELDLGVSGSDIKLKKIEGTVEGELPKFDPKFDIDIDTSLPKTDVEIASPEITMKKEGSVKVPTPDIDIDISGNVPDIELEGDVKVEAPTVDVKGPKIKGKKGKSKMPSCFGKGDKTKKGDAYMPSCEGEISVKSPDVTGKVDVESPSLEGDASIRGLDLKVETKKPKGKLGSCFGKPKSPKAPKVEGKLSSSVEGDLPTLKGEIDAPKAEVKVDVEKPTKKSSSGLGSCFGKKAKVDANIKTPSVDVAAPSGELSVDVDSPKMKSDIKVEEPNLKAKAEVKKPKSKFGSCFGKPKADIDTRVDSPELETDVKVKTPSLDIRTPSVGVEGSVDVPSVGIDDTKLEGDVELRGPKVEGKTPKGSGKGKFKLGSCLGKDKSKSVKVDKPEAEVVIPEGGIKGSVEVEAPKIEGDVKGPKVEGKRKLGLGSCFGKSKSPKLQAEVDVPEPNISGPSTSGGKLDADIKLKSPELDIKADVDSPVIKSEIDVETPEIKVDGKKKKKGSLSSCFGKRKSPDADIKKPSLEVEGEIKGIPSIEGEMKVEGELPSGEIPSKKKKLNLGSCFGKKDKPKLKADIDIQPPKVEISPEIPSVNIEANVPDVTLDPSIKAGTLDLNINNDKPEMSFDLPSVNVEGNIPEASLDVDVPSVSVKSPDIDLDFPKYEAEIEGKVPDISVSHNVDLDIKSPELDFKGDVDVSVEGPKLPSVELDLGVSGSDIKLPKIEGTVEGELPKFDPKLDIDIDTSFPKVDMEVATPKVSLEKEGSIKVPTPDIEMDISGNVPDVELEGDVKVEVPAVDVKGPKIKGKKGKSKMPSCFGKGDKAKKGDAYMPSCEGEISVKSPDVTGKVDVESPSLEGDASIRGPDLKVETKKPKGKLGSCFGKPKSPKAPKVEGKLSSSVEGDLPTLKVEIDAPKAEVKVDVEKPTKKPSSGLGSCFGKKAKVDAKIETPSVDVAAPSGELSVDVDSPQLKSYVKVEEPNLKAKAEVKKPKSKFGSCFGKPKADVDMTVDSPELETDVKVKTPSLNIGTPSVGVEGSVDVPSVGIDDAKLEGDVELRGPKVEGKTPKGSGKGKFKLGSCLGKDKSKSVKVDKPEAEVVIPEGGIKGSVEVETPKIEGDIKVKKENIDVKGPNGKGKVGLGSCFGKSKTPKLKGEVNVPETDLSSPSISSGEIGADVNIKSPTLEIKDNVDSPVIKGDVNVETPEIKVDGKKKKGSLGSCFGKRKSPDADIKKPSLEVEGEIKGVPSIEGEMKVEGELPSGEIPSKKKKLNLGSCFGKKDKPKLKADIDIEPPKAELSAEIPSINIESNVPDVTLDPKVKVSSTDLDININKPEISAGLPSVIIEENIPEISLDADVPSVSLKSPDVNLDFPKYEVGVEGKVPDISVSPNVEMDVKSPDFKEDIDFSFEGPKLPSAELDLVVSGSDIKVPKIEGTVEGELPKFDPKFDIDIDTSFPKVDAKVAAPKISLEKEDSLKVPTPDIEVDISGNVPDVELKGDVKVETPTVDVKESKIKGKKIKSKMPSCFGKNDKDNESAYIPTSEGDVKVKSLHPVDFDASLSSVECNGSPVESGTRNKKKKINFGSCLGKKSGADLKANSKLSSPEVISPVSGELDFSVNGLDSFDGNQLSISSPEKSIHSKGFPQVTVTSNVENDMQVERNGPGGDFSVEFPLASVDNEISGSVRYPDVIAVGADLSASTEKTKPCEGTSFENDFSEDILAQCSNISIDKDYGADISYRYSGDDLPPLYENVSKSSTGKDILPNKKVEFEITSNFPEKTSDIKIVTEPSHTAATASPDLKVHFLDNDDSLEHSHPAYSNIDSRVGVNIPTYENVTFTSPYSLPQKEPSEDVEISEVPKPPKRWFGIDGTTVEGTADIPNVDMKTDFVLKDNETDIPQSIPSEAKSDFQSIQFVKQMVEDDERGEGVNEGRLGKISFTSSRPEVAGQFHTKLNTSDLLAQKLEEFDNNTYDSQPVVKRTIKVKTFKIKEGSDEPEEVIEEFEAEGEELQCDAAKLLSEKLAELRSGFSDSQPEVKRTVRIKTFKTKEGSNEPEELIEEFVNESKIPLDSSAMFKTSFDEKDKRGAKYFEIKDDELKEHAGSFDTSDLLIKKLSEFDMDSSRPVVKRTVRVKTYSTKDGDDDSEEIVEEFEGNEDTSLGKSEATKYLLKKIADFDGKGISGEPFVKRTVKVKTYKTKEGSDDTETIEEFEHSSTDISLSDILHDRYPELRDTKFESHDILKSLENPNSQEALSAQSNVQIGKSGELEGSIQVTHGDAK